VVLCPALTSHSELSETALAEAGISRTTVRISVGDEGSRYLLDHLAGAAPLAFSDVAPEFVGAFPSGEEVNGIYAIHAHLASNGFPEWLRIRSGEWSRER
jgi:O-acetylhomoserine (thiol)-lyase